MSKHLRLQFRTAQVSGIVLPLILPCAWAFQVDLAVWHWLDFLTFVALLLMAGVIFSAFEEAWYPETGRWLPGITGFISFNLSWLFLLRKPVGGWLAMDIAAATCLVIGSLHIAGWFAVADAYRDPVEVWRERQRTGAE